MGHSAKTLTYQLTCCILTSVYWNNLINPIVHDCQDNDNLKANDCERKNKILKSKFWKLETIVEKSFIKSFLYLNILLIVIQPQDSLWL